MKNIVIIKAWRRGILRYVARKLVRRWIIYKPRSCTSFGSVDELLTFLRSRSDRVTFHTAASCSDDAATLSDKVLEKALAILIGDLDSSEEVDDLDSSEGA